MTITSKMKLEFLLSDEAMPDHDSGGGSSSRDRRSSPSRSRSSVDSRRHHSSPRSVNSLGMQESASSSRHNDVGQRGHGHHHQYSSAHTVQSSSGHVDPRSPVDDYESMSGQTSPEYANWSQRKQTRGTPQQPKEKIYKCFCGRAFNKREHLKRHNLLVHQEVRPFTCTICDLHFGTKQNMQVHLTTRKHRQRLAFLAPHSTGSM